MGMRLKSINIITAALAAIVGCVFLLSGQVLAGGDSMSGKTDKDMSKPKMGMTDKQKDMKKTGTTMTKGSKTMTDNKKGMAKDKKMMKSKTMMKDESEEMMDKKGTTKMK